VISVDEIKKGDPKTLARAISLIENSVDDYLEFLSQLPASSKTIIGITGPPGAGKSTLTDALIGQLKMEGKKIAVLCVDPSSPFNKGALLGDRVRMSKWYNDADVFIRSFASRGSLGGLNAKMIEITDLLKAAPFDHIIIETIGVGQTEVEIAGLADITIVVLVPEAGDDIQAMKSGLMEIADIFVVNKCDRPEADKFVMNLQQMLMSQRKDHQVPVLKTVATEGKGVAELANAIQETHSSNKILRTDLMTEKAFQLIIQQKMKHINKEELKTKIEEAQKEPSFNLYQFVQSNY
jgi:LAO/AO transport system kinase